MTILQSEIAVGSEQYQQNRDAFIKPNCRSACRTAKRH
jgi:hypothetical protein